MRPAGYYAHEMQRLLANDSVNGTNIMSEFINKLFNNLNWTISELEVAMRNVRSVALD